MSPVRQFGFLIRISAIPALVSLIVIGGLAGEVGAQDGVSTADRRIGRPAQQLEMIVNTSQVLKQRKKIRRVFVVNPEIIQATPLAPTEVQIAALTPGVTQLNLDEEDGRITTWDVTVTPDTRQLREVLQSEFPDATLRIRPLAKSVYITGYVPRPEMVHEITTLAKEYHQEVINGIAVGGVHQVALHVKVMEVSRTKLRQLGLDWQFLGDDISVAQGSGAVLSHSAQPPGSGLTSDTIRFAVFGDASSFLGYLQALRSQNLVKILSEPTLVTMTGRPATFLSGGSIPIIVPSGLGNFSVEWRTYGTQVDFVPLVLGDATIRLGVRGSVSELDPNRGTELMGTKVPGITERNVDTSVELRAGQSLALAGLIQNRVEANNRGIPWLADLPVVGRLFSRVEEVANEVELLVIVTPELIAPLEAHEVPQCGPGQLTTSPSDKELYCYGYVEVPNGAGFGGNPPPCAAPAAPGGFVVQPADGTPAEVLPLVQPPSADASHSGLQGPFGYDPLP